MRYFTCLVVVATSIALGGCAEPPPGSSASTTDVFATSRPPPTDAEMLVRGEYVVRISGCNDCHTPGYAAQQGEVDKAEWLTGSPLGYTGPWGTTYASNLRNRIAGMDEAQWLAFSATLRTRPIMPDFAVRAMSEEDRRALYRFVRSLGPRGGEAPAYLPPGKRPPPPYMELVLPEAAVARATPSN